MDRSSSPPPPAPLVGAVIVVGNDNNDTSSGAVVASNTTGNEGRDRAGGGGRRFDGPYSRHNNNNAAATTMTTSSLLANSNRRSANSTRSRTAAATSSSSSAAKSNKNVKREADLLLVTSSMASVSTSQSQRRRDEARKEKQQRGSQGGGGSSSVSGGAARQQRRVWDETGSIVTENNLPAAEKRKDGTTSEGRYRLDDIDGDDDDDNDDNGVKDKDEEIGKDNKTMNPKGMQHGFLQAALTNDDTTKEGGSDMLIEQQKLQKQRKQSSSSSKSKKMPQDDRQQLSSASYSTRGNSPEINKNRIITTSNGIPTVVIEGGTVLVDEQQHQQMITTTLPDPEFDVKSYYSRLDAPPSPGGPEKNIHHKLSSDDDAVPMDVIKVGEGDGKNNDGRTTTDGGKNSNTNVTSNKSATTTTTTTKGKNNHTRKRSPPVDPPEIGRGRDCKPTSSTSSYTSAHNQSTMSSKNKNIQTSSNSNVAGLGGNVSEKKNSNNNMTSRNKSGSSSGTSKSVSSSSLRNKAPTTSSAATTSTTNYDVPDGGNGSIDGSWSVTLGRPKGILKNSGKHIPIMQFGQLVVSPQMEEEESIINEHASVMTEDHDDDDDSDPDISQQKEQQLRNAIVPFHHHNDYSNDSSVTGSETSKSTFNTTRSAISTKSGYKPGKYASLNKQFAAVNEDDDDDDSNTNYDDDDFNDVGTYESYMVGGNDGDDDESDDDDDETLNTYGTNTKNSQQRFDRTMTHFLRTTDLGLTQDTVFAEQFLDDAQMKAEPHFHHPSPHPPPGVQFNIDENWVCLDDGIKGSHSPIAPQTVDALVAMGYRAVTDPMMWTPTAKTRKYMTEKGLSFDDIPIPGPLAEGEGAAGDTASCLLWTGKFTHKYHGHDQPAIRSQGIVNMSPEDLVDLLMDSTRVNEYNKCNIGRDDEVVLSDGKNLDSCPFSGQRKKRLTGVVMRGAKVIDGTAVFDSETDDEAETDDDEEQIFEETFDEDGTMKSSVRTSSSKRSRKPRQSNFVGVTKFVRTRNKPPLLRRVLEFFTFLHCRELTDDQGGQGYIIVARAVTPGSIDVESSKKSIMHSEILLNVHIIRRLSNNAKVSSSSSSRRRFGSSSRSGKSVNTSRTKASKSDLSNRCLMINLHHMKCPMVPNMLAKKVGLSAASTFLMDIRNCCD